MGLTIGADVGGTKTAVGVVDEFGSIVERLIVPTPSTDEAELVAAIASAVADLRASHDVVAIGIGAAGLVDESGRSVRFAPHLAWRDAPVADEVTAATGLPARVENDATAAAWAEYRFGTGAGADPLLVVTVGTGLGGGLVVGGELVRGASGAAGEVGHVPFVRDGRPCACGNAGCLEQYASGRALVHEARTIAAADPGSARLMLDLAGGDVEAVNGLEVTRAAGEGDPAALAAFTRVGTALGQGLAGLAGVLDPAAIVVGGGVSEAGPLLMAPTSAAFAARIIGAGHRPLPHLRLASLGNDAGLIGAADLARAVLR